MERIHLQPQYKKFSLRGQMSLLKKWDRDIRAHLKLPTSSTSAYRGIVQQPKVLQIRLARKPTASASDPRYELMAWLDPENNSTPFQPRREINRHECMDAICEVISRVHSQMRESRALRQVLGGRPFAIELFLPAELLFLDVDRQRLTREDGASFVIGMHHNIVLRAAERAVGPHYWLEWRERASTVQQADLLSVMTWIDGMPANYDDLDGQFQDSQVLCVGQTWVPPYTEDQCEIMRRLIWAGIPAAILVRPCPSSPKQVRQILENQLQSQSLHEIAQTVFGWRKSKTAGDERLAEHVAVFWDLPERMPPDIADEFAAEFADREEEQ